MRRSLLASLGLVGILTTAAGVVDVAIPATGTAMRRVPGGQPDRIETNVAIEGGTPRDEARIRLAMHRFEEAGLKLPLLQVVFRSPNHEDCHGGLGYFSEAKSTWRITICSRVDFVYEHELAHAWERSNVTDAQRHRFTVLRGSPTWSDKTFEWNQRGIEWAAFVIQQGLAGLPLPPALSDEAVLRLEGYEMLTGRVAPRLVEWMAIREVPCSERPTMLSLLVVDASDLTCDPSSLSIADSFQP